MNFAKYQLQNQLIVDLDKKQIVFGEKDADYDEDQNNNNEKADSIIM